MKADWADAKYRPARPRFRDKEMAGMTIGAAPNAMVADKLVELCLRNGSVHRALVHIEIQSQRDGALARRVHDYNYHIGKTYGQPVASLVLLADADPNWRPRSFHQKVRGTAMGFSFTTAKLLDYAADTDALEASDHPFAWVTLVHLRTQQAHHDPNVLYTAKLHLTRLLFLHRWKPRRIIVLFNVINWMMVLPEPHQRRYWRSVLRLEREREMKLLNPLEQMFLDDGVKIGLEKGRAEGAAALLERLLTQRFGQLPKTARSKLAKASMEQVEAWSDAFAAAESLKQVFEAAQSSVTRQKK